ncbi:MAG: hypothetical protein AAF614_43395 [Chloroflexota bacterium]
MLKSKKIITVFAIVSLLVASLWATALADGEETLGPPSIDISQGTGIVAAGVGMHDQPGTLDIEVPTGVAIQQVLLYWSGASVNDQPGDNTITVAGVDITGAEIGLGPGRKMFRSYRADITDLGLVTTGANSLSVDNMDFNSENDGAGILVIYDDGGRLAEIEVRDGLDIAYFDRPEPGQTTVPQTFVFEPEAMDRESEIVVMVGSVRTSGPRPNAIHITVGDQFIELVNPLDSADGRQWDTLTIPVTIPAGASELTIEVLSVSDGTDNPPASLTWVNATMSIYAASVVSCANFGSLSPATTVEGLGAVHPLLDIQSPGDAQVVVEGELPAAFGSLGVVNGGLGPENGFTDITRGHEYSFIFAPGADVGYFSLHMIDFGDYNPAMVTEHRATLTAYDVNDEVVAVDSMVFVTDGTPLGATGDAFRAQPGEPGNFQFHLADETNSIARVELRFDNNAAPGRPSDPLFGLRDLCFGQPPMTTCANFGALSASTGVEGLGAVHPLLDIQSPGDAQVVVEGELPPAFGSLGIVNGGLGPGNGFTDLTRGHEYSFAFAPGTDIGYFGLRMIDFGDYNPQGATVHQAMLTGYDVNGEVVAADSFVFLTDGTPLGASGDAFRAQPGDPGNYHFQLTDDTNSITRVELRYSSNVNSNRPSDPLFGLQDLCFGIGTP